MEIKDFLNIEFDNYVNKTFQNESIRKFLINHERRHLLIKNLQREIKDAESFIFSFSTTQKRRRDIIKEVAISFSRSFCAIALDVKEASITNGPKVRLKEVFGEGYNAAISDKNDRRENKTIESYLQIETDT